MGGNIYEKGNGCIGAGNGIAIGYPWEPKNNSTEEGVKLALKF